MVDGQNCVFVTLLRCGSELTILAILGGATWMSYFPPLGRALMTRYGAFLRTEAPVLQWRGPQSFKRLGKCLLIRPPHCGFVNFEPPNAQYSRGEITQKILKTDAMMLFGTEELAL